MLLFLLAAFASSALQAQSSVSIGFNATGLSSLQYNGTQFLSYGDLRLNQIEFLNSDGSITIGSTSSSVSVDSVHQTQTRTYSWGTIVEQYTVSGNRLSLTVTVKNNSNLPIKGIWYEALGLHFPAAVKEYDGNTPLLVTTMGAPAVQSMSYGSGVMVLADDDVALPLQLGFPWALDKPSNQTFPLSVNTDTVFMFPNSSPVINRAIAAGGSDQYHFSLRFGPVGSTTQSLASDVFQAFTTAFPSTLSWPDRRPIGMLMLATTATGWPTNPRGWLLDPTIDVTTQAGLAAFKLRVLAYAQTAVTVLKSMNAQAMITWDIEGEQYSQPTTYIGDPRLLSTLAPEMDAIADQYFQIFRNAGFKIGICLRPQQILLTPGSAPQQIPQADPTQTLIAKVNYARQRWGTTLYYVDSNVKSNTDPNPIDASIFATLRATFPDSLFIPEHSNPQYWAYTAPYLELDQGITGTPALARALYPNGFTVLNVENGPLSQDLSTIAASVAQGDSLLFRAWFDDEPTNGLVQSLYSVLPQVGISVSPTVTSLSAGQTQQFAATVTGTANTGVTWSLSPAVGTISSTGLYTAPASVSSTQTVTVKATSSADSTKSATATITLNAASGVTTSPSTLRINCGGPSYVDSLGQTWSADGLYSSGTVYSTSNAITNTSTPAIYQDQRYGDFSYYFTVPNGTYAVTLKFAELYFTSAGQRVFNVILNGQQVLTNMDVFTAAGGGNKALDETFNVTVQNGQIQIQFVSVTNLSIINAIQIAPSSSSGVSISVNPGSATLTANQSQQFTATMTGSTNTQVSWSILNSGPGSISAAGLYTAPALISSQQTVTIMATSAADSTKTATATITLNPTVAITVSPLTATLTAGQSQQFTATVTGSTNTQASWSLNGGVGSISSSGYYTAPASITSQQTVTITATSAADATKTASATITLSPTVAVTVSPLTATLTAGQPQQFTATVTGSSNTQVSWSLNGAGSISTSGYYTAPSSITSQQTVTVKATSSADSTKTATATITLNPTVAITVSPLTATLTAGQTQQFTATITGSSNTQVSWSILNSGPGSISAAGVYTAPASITSQQTVTIMATSSADSTKTATASITLNPTVTTSSTIRINSGGGGGYVDALGQSWSADAYYSGGSTYSSGSMVTNTSASPLYQDLRYGNFSYNFAVPNGTYTVILKFAEIFFTSPGQRVFNVILNGQQVMTNMDVFTLAGGTNKALDEAFTVAVQNGQIQIQFVSLINMAIVNAIQILPASSSVVAITASPGSVTLAAGQTQQFSATVTGSSNTQVGWSILNGGAGSISAAGLYTAPASISSQQTVMVAATSMADPSKTATATITLIPANATTARVNCGGGNYTDSLGKAWSADTSYSGGTPYSAVAAVANTSDSPLYQSSRYGNFSYSFTVPNGTYAVTLKFAETYWSSAGQRLFNTLINGQQVLTNFDIASVGGVNRAVDEVFNVTVQNGQIQIQFVSVRDWANVNAIQIVPVQ